MLLHIFGGVGSMSKLILKGTPVLIIPSLAVEICLKKTIILQQVRYWLTNNGDWIQGKKWVYNTYKGWHMQHPFWSVSTIKRIIRTLEKMRFWISVKLSDSEKNHTKWYKVDDDQLVQLEEEL
jgi:hypothetical protein